MKSFAPYLGGHRGCWVPAVPSDSFRKFLQEVNLYNLFNIFYIRLPYSPLPCQTHVFLNCTVVLLEAFLTQTFCISWYQPWYHDFWRIVVILPSQPGDHFFDCGIRLRHIMIFCMIPHERTLRHEIAASHLCSNPVLYIFVDHHDHLDNCIHFGKIPLYHISKNAYFGEIPQYHLGDKKEITNVMSHIVSLSMSMVLA